MAKSFKPSKKGVVTGTKYADQVTWASSWKKAITVNAGAGNDIINFKRSRYKNNKLNGDNGNDKIYGGTNIDIIKAGRGNDYVDGGAGNDIIYGQAGTNSLKGGAGNDKIYGGTGIDKIWAGAGNDYIDGGAGNDIIYGQVGTNSLKGGAGNDKIYGGTGIDKIWAGAGNDYIDGGAGNDIISGDNGTNILKGGAGNDRIFGGTGIDKIYAGVGNDIINGGKGTNIIYFNRNEGTNTIVSGGGNDTVFFVQEADLTSINGVLNGTNLILSANGTTANLQNFAAGNHSAKQLNAGNVSFNLTKLNGIGNGNLIFGSNGEDELSASGNGGDIIIGGRGHDTITFSNSDGDNIVILGDDGIADTLVFADLPHLTFNTTILGEVVGNDVVLRYNKIADVYNSSVTIKDFMLNDFAYDFMVKTSSSAPKSIGDIVQNNIDNGVIGNSVVTGSKFKDYVYTKQGLRETINTGDGNDTITTSTPGASGDVNGGDIIYAGAGDDTILYQPPSDEVFIDAGDGADTVNMFKGTVIGGLGADTIRSYGHSTIYGDLTLEDDPEQTQGAADEIYVGNNYMDNIIYGGGGDDTIVGYGGNDHIYGGAGNDTIHTALGAGNEDESEGYVSEVHGGTGNDIIYGEIAKNIIYGDEGNDTLYGWSGGEDVFVFKKGDGTDTIYGRSGVLDTVDTIQFSDESILADNSSHLNLSFSGDDLVIDYNQANDTDKIIIKNYVSGDAINSSINTIKFADNTTKSLKTDILMPTVYATEATTNGTVLSDNIVCSDDFANTIYGGLGNDQIISGTQNDTFYGGGGANIYFVDPQSGFGTDTIYTISGTDQVKFSSVPLSAISANINGDDVELTTTYNSDKVILKDYMNNLVHVTIADNSGFTTSVFAKAGMLIGSGVIEGTSGVDRLIGGDDSDTITGHAGDDFMNGRNDSDIYVFYKGDGHDTVINGTDNQVDYLKFANSTKDELSYDISGNDLVIRYNSGTDSVTVKNYFLEGNTVTKLMDSTCATTNDAFDISEINSYTVVADTYAISGTSLNDVMTFTGAEDHSITGGLGKDRITVGSGTTIVDAGKGDDTINLGTGSATLIFHNGDGHDIVNMNALATTDSYLQFADVNYVTLFNGGAMISGDDLVLRYNYDNNTSDYLDSVTIKDWVTYYDPSIPNIPVINKFKDQNGNIVSNVSDTILARFQNNIDNYYTAAPTITGTKFNDYISTKQGLRETIYGGYGNDNINGSSGASGDNEGGDIIYGGEGNDTIQYANANDTVLIDGGAGDDTIAMSYGIAIGGLGKDDIRRYGFSGTTTIYGDLTLEDDASQTQGGDDLLLAGNNGTNEIYYGGGGNDAIKGKGGIDTIYGGAGDDQLAAFNGDKYEPSWKNTTSGWVSTIHGNEGADHLMAQVDTNILYGDQGNDTFYSFIDQHTTIYDSEGSETLNLLDTAIGDAAKDAINIIFNVSKTYTYDPLNPATLFNGDVMLLNDTGLANWCNGSAYAGITIKENAVERINDSANHYITNANISTLAHSVAGWLSTANGGLGYDDVASVASADRQDLLDLIAANTSWSDVTP